jgi:uncharacterized repeat protein (TIGR01451 family)
VDGRANMTVDFGFVPVFTIGNRVWFDTDNSGTINAGEVGVAGVTVNIINSVTGTIVKTVVTDADGYYRADVLQGTYIVEIPASNFAPGGPLNGTVSSTPDELNPDGDVDSSDNGLGVSPDPVTGIRSGVVTIGPAAAEPTGELDVQPAGQGNVDNRANMTVDFGFVPQYSLGNRVWRDDDNSGTINGAEVPIAAVTVQLLDNAGAIIATTTTDANGHYRFDNLYAGTYSVRIPAANFLAGAPLNTMNSSSPDEANPNADIDSTDNGLGTTPDPATGISSGPVTLGPGNPEPTSEVDLAASGQGNFDARANMTVDFGFVPVYSLGNRVWNDPDDSGTMGAAEVGFGGVTVNLLNAAGTVIATTTTDASGYYRFDNLLAGNYTVEIPASNFATGAPLAGYGSSTPTSTNPNDNIDRDDNGAPVAGGAVRSGTVTLGPADPEPVGETDLGPGAQGPTLDTRANMTVDFGFVQLATIVSRVWDDTNQNGTQDPGEPSRPNVPVLLIKGGAVVGTATTDPTGIVTFPNLPPGSYQLEWPPPTGTKLTTANQGDDATDSDGNETTHRSPPIQLGPGQTVRMDVGLVSTTAPPPKPTKLAITKRGPKLVKAGTVITFTITVKNIGTSFAQNVIVRDQVPKGLTSAQPGVRVQKGVITFTVGNLDAGATRKIRVKMALSPKLKGSIINRATARATNAPLVRAQWTVNVLAIAGQGVPGVTG